MAIMQCIPYIPFLIKKNIERCIFLPVCTSIMQNLEKSNEMAFQNKMRVPFSQKIPRLF